MSSPEFQLFRHGKPIKVKWAEDEMNPIIRLLTYKNFVFLLTKRHKLYYGNYDIKTNSLSTELWRENVIDIDLYNDHFYLVNTNGSVYLKQLSEDLSVIFAENWSEIVFKSNGVLEASLKIIRVKSNLVGTIYLTENNEIYGQGNCGVVLNSEKPVNLGKFFENQKVIDIRCGEDFFLVLTQNCLSEDDDEDLKLQNPLVLKNLKISKTKNCLERKNTSELVLPESSGVVDHKTDSKESLNSSKASSSIDITTRIQEILRCGYFIINTGVCSFGAKNESVLGTGDHIKRQDVKAVLNLTNIGCNNICCGKEHSITRTLDGRIFHWGLNTHLQQVDNTNEKDITSPKELQVENFSHVLEACCDNYSTVLANNGLKIFIQPTAKKENVQEHLKTRVFTLHSVPEKNYPIILSANKFTLFNCISLETNYQDYFISMQLSLRTLLRNKSYVIAVDRMQSASGQHHLKYLSLICKAYLRIIYGFAACLKSIENFYRKDIEYTDLLFLQYSQELIQILEDYTQFYSDIKSINGYHDINRAADFLSISNYDDYEKIFASPFCQISNIVQFCETLCKNYYITNQQNSNFLIEKLNEWQEFSRHHCIDIELSEHTQTFWLKNSRNSQIRPFKKTTRRVILDSTNLPLKLSAGGAFSSNSFILFSDCLCQYGSNLQTFPLLAMWVKIEGDTSIRIYTPEKSFVLIARNHEDKMLWYDQLSVSISSALGKPSGSKLTNIRNTVYTFSDKHSMYPKVRACGRWRLGIMHGTFYLEYPDGKIYFGDIKNNEIEGFGKMIIPSTGIYEGYFKSGKFNGFGNYEMKDNVFYEGYFRDSLFHGHGLLRTNDYTYLGEFSSNAKNGYGIYDDLISGNKYMGMFAANRKTGAGTCFTINGDYFEGFFINDDITGEGLAIFSNEYYYEGSLTLKGPDGKGVYYMQYKELPEDIDSDENEVYMEGNIMSGNLGGTWNDVRIINGSMAISKKFPKLSRIIGNCTVDNDRKWRSLFENWTDQVFGTSFSKNPKQIWNKIAIFMTSQREKEKSKEQNSINTASSFFAKNITLETNKADLFLMKLSNSLDKISLSSATSSYLKRNTLDITDQRKKSYSNEALYVDKFDQDFERFYEENYNLNSLFNYPQFDNFSIQSTSTRSSIESSASLNNNLGTLDFVPSFGITSLEKSDVEQIRQYLEQAFKDQYHPLGLLNQKISNCFYTSYGCWRVKPTTILAHQAIKEWESISIRIYKIIKKMFPALPEEYCEIQECGEIISHSSLLYPILLSEGIYSTLCVLYANKFRDKDELYRQRILLIDKKTDEELTTFLSLEESLLHIIKNDIFKQAILTFKQITEECSPKGMLDVIEKSMQLIHEAHKDASETAVISDGGADNVIPLTLFLVLRANVPHLGAELALLDDLTGEANHELDMSGLAGYCFTTVKAAYEHIIKGNLFETLEQHFFSKKL